MDSKGLGVIEILVVIIGVAFIVHGVVSLVF